MAALLEKVRNFQRYPAMSREEREAEFGTYNPIVKRASRLKEQKNMAVKTDPLNQDLAQKIVTGKITTIRRTTTSGQLPQAQQKSSFWVTIGKGLLILAGFATALYTAIFLLALIFVWTTNFAQFGPTHTAYTQTVIDGQASTIVTNNTNNTIYVTIINQKDGSAKTYTGPALDPNAWDGDTHSIVATAEVAKNQVITINLIGNVNYFHLFLVRPQMQFDLVPDKTGYKVVLP